MVNCEIYRRVAPFFPVRSLKLLCDKSAGGVGDHAEICGVSPMTGDPAGTETTLLCLADAMTTVCRTFTLDSLS